jgi:hypothetical protein
MRRSLFVTTIAALAACSHREAAPPPPPVAPITTPVTTDVPGSQDLAPLQQLGVRLSDEAKHRPAVKVPAEKLFAALSRDGIALASHHQVLAAAAAAQYCDLGVTKETIAIAVCEYATAADAAKARTFMAERYAKLVPDAVRTLNGSTLVTIANASSHPELRDRVIHTFLSL